MSRAMEDVMRIPWSALALSAALLVSCGGEGPAAPEAQAAPPAQPAAVTRAAPPEPRTDAEALRLREVAAAFSALRERPISEADLAWTDWINRRLIYKWSEADRDNLALLHYLEQLSEDPDPVVAYHALFSLGKLGEGRVFTRLVEALMTHPNGYIRGYAARALGHLGEPGARPFLTEALEDPFISWKGDLATRFVRECARTALREVP